MGNVRDRLQRSPRHSQFLTIADGGNSERGRAIVAPCLGSVDMAEWAIAASLRGGPAAVFPRALGYPLESTVYCLSASERS
jgi:hypothetical protein